MRRANLFRFYNENIPSLGCGWRSVVALPEGRKWVTVVEWTTLDVAKISLKDWERMKPQSVRARAGLVFATMKSRVPYRFAAAEGKRPVPTQSIKKAMKIVKGAAA